MPDVEEEEEVDQDPVINWCEHYHDYHQSDIPNCDVLEENTEYPPSKKYSLRSKGLLSKQNIVSQPKNKTASTQPARTSENKHKSEVSILKHPQPRLLKNLILLCFIA